MTLVIETTPGDEMLLQQEAVRRGVSREVLARELLREALEDLEDAADAARVLEGSNPQEWASLDDLRRAVRGS